MSRSPKSSNSCAARGLPAACRALGGRCRAILRSSICRPTARNCGGGYWSGSPGANCFALGSCRPIPTTASRSATCSPPTIRICVGSRNPAQKNVRIVGGRGRNAVRAVATASGTRRRGILGLRRAGRRPTVPRRICGRRCDSSFVRPGRRSLPRSGASGRPAPHRDGPARRHQGQAFVLIDAGA